MKLTSSLPSAKTFGVKQSKAAAASESNLLLVFLILKGEKGCVQNLNKEGVMRKKQKGAQKNLEILKNSKILVTSNSNFQMLDGLFEMAVWSQM